MQAKAMDGSTEHDAQRGAAQSGSEQECGSMPAKAMAPRTSTSEFIQMTDQTIALEAGYYWVRDRGNPHLMIQEWSPECGAHGLWFAPGIDGGFPPDWIEVCSKKLTKPGDERKERQDDGLESELIACLSAFVSETVDYMTRNNLGDPEQQHNVKWARSILP